MKIKTASFHTVTIIGGGLIGSSIARAIRKYQLSEKIFIYDKSDEIRKKIESLNICNKVFSNPLESVYESDLIFLCVPVGSMKEAIASISTGLKKGAIISDTGSTKKSVINDVTPFIPKNVSFIPSHPLAGTEFSGPEYGNAELFKGKYWIIINDKNNSEKQVKKLAGLYSKFGSIIEFLDVDYHDKITAITSHLPHLIAYTIVGTVTDLEEQTKKDIIRFSASGFRDFTRIAASDPIMWRDVFINNKDAVLEMLQRFSEDLSYLQRAIRWSESEKLEKLFTKTRDIRKNIIKEGQDR